jgi:glycosyltransferase involved in cell wall biosynthesis
MEGFGWYTYEVVKRIVCAHPEHEFYFFFDRPYDPKFIFAKNVTPIVLNPPARHPVLFIYWFEIAVRKALKKHSIDLFFSPDGYLSLSSSVKQVIAIHDINFEHHPRDLPFTARLYLRYFFPRFARKATEIITVSHYSLKDIETLYGVASEEYVPLDDISIKLVRNKYSSGEPYFLFVGSMHPRKNLLRLLRAFSEFKKREGSSMKILLVGTSMWGRDKELEQLIHSLGDDVIITGHLEKDELCKVTAAAFALTFVPYYEGFGIPIVEAMRCGVPVICGNRTSLPEVAGDAALLCDPFDERAICERMTELATDDILYMEFKRRGLERSTIFNWDQTALHVWKVIEKHLK